MLFRFSRLKVDCKTAVLVRFWVLTLVASDIFNKMTTIPETFSSDLVVRNFSCNARDTGLIPGHGTKIGHTVSKSVCISPPRPNAAQ